MTNSINPNQEALEVFDIHGNYIDIQDRKSYFKEIIKEYEKNNSVTKQVKRVTALILSPDGEIILQKRSDDKKENPGMYDKSVGGHIMVMKNSKHLGTLNKELSDLNMVKELLEELSVASYILPNDLFNDGLSFDLEKMAIITKIERIMGYHSKRIKPDGTDFKQGYISENYFGYYSGSFKFSDKESCGLEYIGYKKLLERIKKYPKQYTPDLIFLINRYKEYLLPINDFKEKYSNDGGFNLSCASNL